MAATEQRTAPLPTLLDIRTKHAEWVDARDTVINFFGEPVMLDGTRKIARTVHPAPHGTYMVTSEPALVKIRFYTLWFVRASGEIVMISELSEYPTLSRAHRHARAMAEGDWRARRRVDAMFSRIRERVAAEAELPDGARVRRVRADAEEVARYVDEHDRRVINGQRPSYEGNFDPDVNPPIVRTSWTECHSGEGAIYSLPYLKRLYGRDTA